jgi:hypothetical protein
VEFRKASAKAPATFNTLHCWRANVLSIIIAMSGAGFLLPYEML